MIGGNCSKPAARLEQTVSQEFLTWYRRVLKAPASRLVHKLNERLSELSTILPTAAAFLESVLTEARET
jgi:hypothetical protein